MHTNTQTHTDTQTHRHTQTHTHTNTHKHTGTDTDTNTNTDRQTDTHTHTQTEPATSIDRIQHKNHNWAQAQALAMTGRALVKHQGCANAILKKRFCVQKKTRAPFSHNIQRGGLRRKKIFAFLFSSKNPAMESIF